MSEARARLRGRNRCKRARPPWKILPRYQAKFDAKPVGAWGTSQPLIPRGEQSGLLTHIATESGSSSGPTRSSQRFSNLNESHANHSACPNAEWFGTIV